MNHCSPLIINNLVLIYASHFPSILHSREFRGYLNCRNMSACQSGWNGMFPLEAFKGNTAHLEMSTLLCFVFITPNSLASLSRAPLHQHPNPMACVPYTLVTRSPHSFLLCLSVPFLCLEFPHLPPSLPSHNPPLKHPSKSWLFKTLLVQGAS